MRKKNFLRFFLLTLTLLILAPSILLAAPIRMGFVGGRSPEGIVRQWTPFIDYLSNELGIQFEMVIREDYLALIDVLNSNDIDIFEGGALSHVIAAQKGNVEALASEVRSDFTKYTSVFAVREDSGLNSISDLKGKKLALSDPLSTSGYFIPLLILNRIGVRNVDEYFGQIILSGSQDRSIEALLEGTVDAIAIGDFFLNFLSEEQRSKIKIIATSEPVAMGPITVNKKLDPVLKQKIRQALFDYEYKVPEDVRKKIIEVQKFIPFNEVDMNYIKELLNSSSLPKLNFSAQYLRIARTYSDAIDAEKNRALYWMIASFLVFSITAGFAAFHFRKRLLMFVALPVVVIVVIIAGLFSGIEMLSLYSSVNTKSAKWTASIENMNLRAMASLAGISSESLDSIVAKAVSEGPIRFARIYRNGEILASSNPNEVGASIIAMIRSGTFFSSDGSVKSIADPIIVNGRRYANLQIGVSIAEVYDEVNRFIVTNIVTLLLALFAGLVASLVVNKKLLPPLKALSCFVDGIKEGDNPSIPVGASEIKEVRDIVDSLADLSKNISDKEKLFDLKSTDDDLDDSEMHDLKILHELSERISEIELANEYFRKVRIKDAIGNSPSWLRTLRDAAIRACDKSPVLIIGPSGSGKTGIARAVHALSSRAESPMGEFNCAEFASADPLVVLGKLFGYGTDSGINGIDRKGQKGVLEEFEGGTVFFDEMEFLPMQAQQLLMLPLEGRPYNPAAGKGKAKTSDVRFIFATNASVNELLHSGKVRHDFLRRILARGILKIRPLSSRTEDIELLAINFLSRRNKQSERQLHFTDVALRLIRSHRYERYNVSELLGVVDQAFDRALFENSTTIDVKHLGPEFIKSSAVEHLIEKQDNECGKTFDDEELLEIIALRENSFNISAAEKKLGYSVGSKTLTNHLRGIVYRSLQRNDWNIEDSVCEIAATSDPKILENLTGKVEDYLENAKKHLQNNSTDKLFNNLPRKYDDSLRQLLSAIETEASPFYKKLFTKLKSDAKQS